jgi:hypothetical protein
MIRFKLTRSVSEETTYAPRLRVGLVSFSAARRVTLFHPVALTAFALLAISSSGCLLFSGRPCEPGDWHYHSGWRQAEGCRECRTSAASPPRDDLDDAYSLPDRQPSASGKAAAAGKLSYAARIRPHPGPLPEGEGDQTGPLPEEEGDQSRPCHAAASQVAQDSVRNNSRRMDLRVRLASEDGPGGPSYKSEDYVAPSPHLQWKDPFRPRLSTKARPQPGPAEEAAGADVQNCNWQQPDDMPSQPARPADTAKPAPQRRPATRDLSAAESTKNPGSPPARFAVVALPDKPPPEPFAWGYFGASGKW